MADEMNTLLLQYYFHELILQMPSYNYDILKGKHSGWKYASFETLKQLLDIQSVGTVSLILNAVLLQNRW